MSEAVEVVREHQQWHVRFMVQPKVWLTIASYRLKHDAVVVARFFCNQRTDRRGPGESVELIIKDRWGRIQDKDTYGYDPEESEG